jgi:tryptophan synthase alpha chain
VNRIQKKFRELKKQGQKALIPFMTAGDPSLEETKKLIFTLEKAGADIIELGIPFSDPMADGPVIQKASERALKKKVTLSKILALVKKVRKKTQIPILLMGYYNPLFLMGHDVFAQKAREAGVDAVLVVDLPPEEAQTFQQSLKKEGVDFVVLLTPTSDESRMKRALKLAKGFVYYVSLTGVTGASLKEGAMDELPLQLQKLQALTTLPVAVGFGISKPKQAHHVAQMADGVVVGSQLVNLIASTNGSTRHQRVFKFIHSLKVALNR